MRVGQCRVPETPAWLLSFQILVKADAGPSLLTLNGPAMPLLVIVMSPRVLACLHDKEGCVEDAASE